MAKVSATNLGPEPSAQRPGAFVEQPCQALWSRKLCNKLSLQRDVSLATTLVHNITCTIGLDDRVLIAHCPSPGHHDSHATCHYLLGLPFLTATGAVLGGGGNLGHIRKGSIRKP